MRRQTLFYIILILALGVVMYLGKEMFTTTITIPDAPPGPQGPPGPPGPQGPTGLTGYDGSSTTKTASTTKAGLESLSASSTERDRILAYFRDQGISITNEEINDTDYGPTGKVAKKFRELNYSGKIDMEVFKSYRAQR